MMIRNKHPLNFLEVGGPVHYSEVNRQKHIGVRLGIKNCPFNRSDCYIEVL